MRFDEIIHSSRVCRKDRAVGWRKRAGMLFGDVPRPQPPGFAIQFERGCAENFRQLPGCQTPQHVHLPQAILRRRVALQENRVFPSAGCDVGHSQSVARDAGLSGNRRIDLAGGLRQRPISNPIDSRQNQHQQNRYAQVDELQGSSEKHWDDSTVPLFQRRDLARVWLIVS